MPNLSHLKAVRHVAVSARRLILTKFWGMDIHPTVQLSMRAELDRTYPRGVHIAEYSYVAFGAVILCHDRTRGLFVDTWIEKNCFIGAHSMILPGLRVGEGSIVGAGAVVTKDVPPRSIVAGNPAKIIRSDIETIAYGRLADADDVEAEIKAAWREQGR